jgi:NAD+ synthase
MSSEEYSTLSSAIEEWIAKKVGEASVNGLVVGLSGGIDSSVCAALGARALGSDKVLGLVMPCGSSREDTEDGIRIAEHLGIRFHVMELSKVLDEFLQAGKLTGTSALNKANIKARLRMTMLYAHSRDKLVLGTSNYSEILVGYWTKWGDGAADLLPIAGLYKDEVKGLARNLGLPDWVVERTPSAGLWPGQSDEEEMGVTYLQIRSYFQGEELPQEVSRRIQGMVKSTQHKRDPIPFFDARRFLDGR